MYIFICVYKKEVYSNRHDPGGAEGFLTPKSSKSFDDFIVFKNYRVTITVCLKFGTCQLGYVSPLNNVLFF